MTNKNENITSEEIKRAKENALLILSFCLQHMMVDRARKFALMPIDFSEFKFFFNVLGGNLDELEVVIQRRIDKIEKNRIASVTKIEPPDSKYV